jgi:hypothetical protein
MVCTDHGEATDVTLNIDRVHHRDVGQVGAAGKRIVEHERVTRRRIERPHRSNGLRHRPQMYWNVRGLRDHLALHIKERRR